MVITQSHTLLEGYFPNNVKPTLIQVKELSAIRTSPDLEQYQK